jgi:hypothetical protein
MSIKLNALEMLFRKHVRALFTALPALTAFVACGFALLSAVPAHALNADIYLGSLKDDKKAIVVFAFDDPSKSGFTPESLLAIYADPDYELKPDQPFDPSEACRFTYAFTDPDKRALFQPSPIYGPSSGRQPIGYFDLPTFFAQQATIHLLSRGAFMKDSPAYIGYSSCVGFVWARELSQPSEVWQKIVDQVREQ